MLQCRIFQFEIYWRVWFEKKTIKDEKEVEPNGDIVVFEGILYVIIHRSVKSISLEDLNTGAFSFETRFNTNTDCNFYTGLAIDGKNKHLLYTSEDMELVCTSLDGEVIYSCENEGFIQLVSLATHPNGTVFVASKNGPIFGVSEDGKQTRKLLNKTKKIKKISDISFNISLAVCGTDYLEIYDVLAET